MASALPFPLFGVILQAQQQYSNTMDNAFVKSFPGMMQGKKILYVHGFASSGQSGTVAGLRELLPQATVIAPDLPIHPAEAMELLHRICAEECPDLAIGTSMGGMYAEMLYGLDRILVNPAFRMGDTILKNNRLGKVTFLNPRLDGLKEFMMTKQLMEEYREMTERCFASATAEEQERVYGLFGIEDTMVNTFDLFATHYANAIRFHGEHQLNNSTLLHAVVPVIRWIDDRQQKRQRNIVYISVEQTMERGGNALPSVLKAYRLLLENYDVYLVAALPPGDGGYADRVQEWLFETVGVPSYRHMVFTNHKELLYGDYLIDATEANGSQQFMGTRIGFGTEAFKTWDDVIAYFGRLGGQ